MDSEVLRTSKLTDAVTLMTPTPRYSDGVPFEDRQLEIGAGDVPDEIQQRTKDNPFAQWIADSMAYGNGPTLVATVKGKVFYVSHLADRLQGLLIGEIRPFEKIRWIEYRRIEGQTFEEARDLTINWTAKTRELLPVEVAA